MDQRHREYVEYYRARLAKYEDNPMYPHSAAAERALYDAISSCAQLEEFEQLEAQNQLSFRCAVALVRDKYTAESNLYLELQETVRAQPGLEVLRNLDASPPADVNALNTMVTDVETRWQQHIARDETLIVEYWNDYKIMEDIEEFELAQVPDAWHAERQRFHAKELERGASHYREHSLPKTRDFFPDYQPNWQELWQPRHRRKVPLSDEVFNDRIARHMRYVGWS